MFQLDVKYWKESKSMLCWNFEWKVTVLQGTGACRNAGGAGHRPRSAASRTRGIEPPVESCWRHRHARTLQWSLLRGHYFREGRRAESALGRGPRSFYFCTPPLHKDAFYFQDQDSWLKSIYPKSAKCQKLRSYNIAIYFSAVASKQIRLLCNNNNPFLEEV